MTITANDTRNEYTATAGQTVFSYTFKIFEDTDVIAYVTPAGQEADDTTDGVTVLSVTGAGNEDGGTVTLAAVTLNYLVTIVSNIPETRTTDYQSNGDFIPETVNDDFDRVVSLVKQIGDVANRSIVTQEAQQGTKPLTLPAPASLQFIRWKSDLSGMENVDLTSLGSPTNASVITYNQGGTGAIDRTSEERFQERVSVQDFGALGDGSTDDTTAIQLADTAAAATGQSLYFPNTGSAYMATTLIQNTSWFGDNTSIQQVAATTGNLITMASSNVTLTGFVVDGNKANQTQDNFTLFATDVDYLAIEGNTFKDGFNGNLKLKGISNSRLINNVFTNGGDAASSGRNEVSLDKTASNRVKSISIVGNTFVGAAIATGDNVGLIMGSGCEDISVTGNTFSSYESESIQVLSFNGGLEDTDPLNRPFNISIVGNVVDGSDGSAAGVHVGENCDHVTVVANSITGADLGVKVGQWVENVIVSCNNITSSVGAGVSISGKAYGSITVNDNNILNCGTSGVLISGTAGDTLTGVSIQQNVCKNNGDATGNDAGIRIAGPCALLTISNNICTDDNTIQLQKYGVTLENFVYTELSLTDNELRGNLTASALVNVARNSFSSSGNKEGSSPNLFNATFTYGPIAGSGNAVAWTSATSAYDDRRFIVRLFPTNPGASAGDSGDVQISVGRAATGRDRVVLYNHSANAANGSGFIFFED